MGVSHCGGCPSSPCRVEPIAFSSCLTLFELTAFRAARAWDLIQLLERVHDRSGHHQATSHGLK
jgi:hypothetical protein